MGIVRHELREGKLHTLDWEEDASLADAFLELLPSALEELFDALAAAAG